MGVHGTPWITLTWSPVRMFGSMRCIRCWNSLSHWFSTEATALAIGQTPAAVECFGWKPNEIQPLTINRPDVGIAGCCPHFYDEPLAALRFSVVMLGAFLILSAFLLNLKEREWPYMVADDNIFRSYLTNEYRMALTSGLSWKPLLWVARMFSAARIRKTGGPTTSPSIRIHIQHMYHKHILTLAWRCINPWA